MASASIDARRFLVAAISLSEVQNASSKLMLVLRPFKLIVLFTTSVIGMREVSWLGSSLPTHLADVFGGLAWKERSQVGAAALFRSTLSSQFWGLAGNRTVEVNAVGLAEFQGPHCQYTSSVEFIRKGAAACRRLRPCKNASDPLMGFGDGRRTDAQSTRV